MLLAYLGIGSSWAYAGQNATPDTLFIETVSNGKLRPIMLGDPIKVQIVDQQVIKGQVSGIRAGSIQVGEQWIPFDEIESISQKRKPGKIAKIIIGGLITAALGAIGVVQLEKIDEGDYTAMTYIAYFLTGSLILIGITIGGLFGLVMLLNPWRQFRLGKSYRLKVRKTA
ncbi:MAG: hypothetical protein AAFR61_07470 [Bacteroidota bacterium]